MISLGKKNLSGANQLKRQINEIPNIKVDSNIITSQKMNNSNKKD